MSVYTEDYLIPGADLGPENPFPSFRIPEFNHKYDCDELNVPQEDRDTFGYAIGWRVLPYRVLDRYDSSREIRKFESVILENEILKVRIVPEFGGMVADIFHKPLQKELIYRNPVYQPRNLALCDAWLSGGIEFNTAHLGHHYLTCRPLHTAIVRDGEEEFVRIFAWERVKCFPYQIDLHLPKESQFLFIHVKIINPHDYMIPMYWWTNIGMEEYPDGRVIAPCDETYETSGPNLRFVNCPIIDGVDKSYVSQQKSAYDLFFRIPPERRKWEVLVDKDGEGLLHVATDRLKSTKVFAWGNNPGSKHWSEYLSKDGHKPFQEIQFGLAPSQMHSDKMPKKTTWEWTEAISYFKGDKEILHGDWKEAYAYGTDCVDEMLSREELDKYDEKYTKAATISPEKVLYKGLGWGALEKELRKNKDVTLENNNPTPIPDYFAFDQSDMGEDQEMWLNLLKTGEFPERSIYDDPGQFMIQPEWEALLEKSIKDGKSNNWFAWFHLGVMKREKEITFPPYCEKFEYPFIKATEEDLKNPQYPLCLEDARECFKKSIECKENVYAYYGLANIAFTEKKDEEMIKWTLKAWECIGDQDNLKSINLGSYIAPGIMKYYLGKKEYDKCKKFYDSLCDRIKDSERVRLQWGYLAFELGLDEEVEKVINSKFDNIAEGEVSVTGLWYKYYARGIAKRDGVEYTEEFLEEIKNTVNPPHDLDFRMFVGDGEYVPPSER